MTGFVAWWQHLPENMNPYLLRIGNFGIPYYGLMYLVAFAIAYFLAVYRINREDRFSSITKLDLQDLMKAMIFGVLIGGRLGYVIFYNLAHYARNPLEIILPFDISAGWKFVGIAGMSFHGGLLGVILAVVIITRRRKWDFRNVGDLIAPCAPLGYTFGRLGNFINAELYGRVTHHPIGMFFPQASGVERRHPSQLYEAFFEGIFLFAVLWLFRKRIKTPGAMFPLYLIGYGIVRFLVEYTREPDAHLGFVLFRLSMGQILSLGMIVAGVVIILFLRRSSQEEAGKSRKSKRG